MTVHSEEAVIRQKGTYDGAEPTAVGLISRLSQVQQQNRPQPSTASQQDKRPFVVGAAKSGGPMTELRTILPLIGTKI